MWNWILSLFNKEYQGELGALLDQRPEATATLSDIPFNEVVAESLAPIWTEVPKNEIRQFGIGNREAC